MRFRDNGQPTKGWGPWRYDWFSFCSKKYDPDCSICRNGHWVNNWVRCFDSFVWRHAPGIWKWWHNRPNSRTRRRLEKAFPKLRRPV